VLKVRTGPVIGLIAQLALLAALAGTTGLGAAGWVVGVAFGVVTAGGLTFGLDRRDAGTLGPADRVTLARAVLVGGVAALVADSFTGAIPVPVLVALASVALALDAVDGWVARRTGTVSTLGARFDMETDAFLILVLSGYVAFSFEMWWVLAIGAARYLFVAAGWLLPWMRAGLPVRRWRKVVAAVQGVVLAVAAADLLPRPVTDAALVGALVLLAESFGRDVWWLFRHRAAVAGAAAGTHRSAALVLPTAADTAAQAVAVGVVDGSGGGRQTQQDDAAGGPTTGDASEGTKSRGRVRAAAAAVTTVLAALLVWFALVAPNEMHDLMPSAFLRIPIEGLLFVAVLLAIPARARTPVAFVVGAVLGLLTIVKVLDMGFFFALDRQFNPITDWGYLGSAVGLLSDSIGHSGAVLSVIAVLLVVLAVIVFTPLAVVRLSRIVAGHRTASIRTVTAVGAAWVLFAAFGVQIGPGAPIASTSAAALTYDQVSMVRAGIQDQEEFAAAVADDQFGTAQPVAGGSAPVGESPAADAPATDAPATDAPATNTAVAQPAGASTSLAPPALAAAAAAAPGGGLLSGLQGKDVIVAFVESYGRVAVQDSPMAPAVDATLDAGTQALDKAGFSAQSGFLHSPTYGGLSWLAHSTFQSGLWIDNQQRYDQLVASDRLTIASAFKRAGWRTVADVPSNETAWPEGKTFFHYDQIYDETNVGYAGPKFSYAAMPDQFIMSAFQRMELGKPGRGPLMAEIDLVSSHWPWAPIPHMIDWNQVGDGSIYDGMPEQGQSPDVISKDQAATRAAYAESIQYSLNTLISFMQTYADKNLVLVMLGDHEPASTVSGEGTTHDVPISIISQDPAVMNRISDWGWTTGLRPAPQAPVWPMDAFRDRFLTAYSG